MSRCESVPFNLEYIIFTAVGLQSWVHVWDPGLSPTCFHAGRFGDGGFRVRLPLVPSCFPLAPHFFLTYCSIYLRGFRVAGVLGRRISGFVTPGMVWDMTSICLRSAGFVGGDSGFDLCPVFLPFVELHVFAFVSLLLSDSFAFHVGGFLDRGFGFVFLLVPLLPPIPFPILSLSLRTLCCPGIAGVSHLIRAGLPTCLHALAGFSKKMFHKGLELPRSSSTTCSAAGTFCPQACGEIKTQN